MNLHMVKLKNLYLNLCMVRIRTNSVFESICKFNKRFCVRLNSRKILCCMIEFTKDSVCVNLRKILCVNLCAVEFKNLCVIYVWLAFKTDYVCESMYVWSFRKILCMNLCILNLRKILCVNLCMIEFKKGCLWISVWWNFRKIVSICVWFEFDIMCLNLCIVGVSERLCMNLCMMNFKRFYVWIYVWLNLRKILCGWI